MTKQITLEEALKLVSFYHADTWGWQVRDVNVDVKGDIHGDVGGDVFGTVGGNIYGDVNVFGAVGGNIYGDVNDHVWGKINGREWEYVETPKEKLQ